MVGLLMAFWLAQGRDIIDSLPVALREELAGTFYYSGLFSKVWPFVFRVLAK